MQLDCAGKIIDLRRPRVMGILNVTPDSFSDGGAYLSVTSALEHALEMVAEGVDIIDVGGESTRPGAQPVSEQEELDRVIPVIEALSAEISVPVSIDTSKPRVMREAVAAGAGMINDVMALRAPGAVEIAAKADVPVCLMHMQGEPRSMQAAPTYEDVTLEVRSFLEQRLTVCRDAGIANHRLLVDPGFGFGKRLEHNLQLLRDLTDITSIGVPVLAGISRKSMLGSVLDVPVEERLYGSVAAAVIAAMQGAAIIRAHDVRPTVDAIKVMSAVFNNAVVAVENGEKV
jgi:dihydropteroate synthase